MLYHPITKRRREDVLYQKPSKTIEHIQADDILSILCFHDVCRILNATIEKAGRSKIMVEMRNVTDPLEIMITVYLEFKCYHVKNFENRKSYRKIREDM